MEVPIRSRLLDYAEYAEAEPPAGADTGPAHGRSPLLDYMGGVDAGALARDDSAGPKPGVPAYHTAVYVPAHPRYADIADADGRPARVPFIAYELFAHPSDGSVALAFTTLEKLVSALGPAQPWIAASIGPLAEGMRGHGARVRLDPELAPGHHNWQRADLAAYAREVS
ncbi:SAV_915 family protein [Streptomyces sp. NPDC090032]|uniref:SAV_915 family protein n=1 Tax=unclassified Streptomyces TaxID=2593676 RepID=UPI00371C9ADE